MFPDVLLSMNKIPKTCIQHYSYAAG